MSPQRNPDLIADANSLKYAISDPHHVTDAVSDAHADIDAVTDYEFFDLKDINDLTDFFSDAL